jgi:polyhydroxybutyrate depolymerase
MFHGWGGNENNFLGNSRLTTLASLRGYVLVAPRGLGSGASDFSFNSWSFSGSTTGLAGDGGPVCAAPPTPDYSYASCAGTAANSCSWTHCQADDVAFVEKLTEHIKGQLCIDEDNVFATGGSNGGMFTWELAQDPRSAPLFRAIAPLIGLPHKGYLEPPGKPGEMPALLITGTFDTTVPPGEWEDPSHTITSNGSDRFFYSGATAITRSWASAHGCNVGADARPLDLGGQSADCRSYCQGGAGTLPPVVDCRIAMGHVYRLSTSWPLMLRFFEAHRALD